MTVLERESGLFIRKAELFRFGPELDDIGSGHARFDGVDGLIQDIPAVLVGVYLRLRRAANDERAIVAGAVAHVAVQDVEVGWVTGPQGAVGIDMRMGATALAGNGIDAFDVLRTQVDSTLLTRPTHSFSRMPGFIARYSSS